MFNQSPLSPQFKNGVNLHCVIGAVICRHLVAFNYDCFEMMLARTTSVTHHSFWNELNQKSTRQAVNWPGRPAQILTGCNYYPCGRTLSLIPGFEFDLCMRCLGSEFRSEGSQIPVVYFGPDLISTFSIDVVQCASLIGSRWASWALLSAVSSTIQSSSDTVKLLKSVL